jgi:hypothetical protein
MPMPGEKRLFRPQSLDEEKIRRNPGENWEVLNKARLANFIAAIRAVSAVG